jgi:hypothetical protein
MAGGETIPASSWGELDGTQPLFAVVWRVQEGTGLGEGRVQEMHPAAFVLPAQRHRHRRPGHAGAAGLAQAARLLRQLWKHHYFGGRQLLAANVPSAARTIFPAPIRW